MAEKINLQASRARGPRTREPKLCCTQTVLLGHERLRAALCMAEAHGASASVRTSARQGSIRLENLHIARVLPPEEGGVDGCHVEST
eukprot:6210025-Pleurochrysis_carterae.AAC.1